MLRKVLVMSLVQIYALSVIGLPLHFHYCKGELQHISLLIKTDCDDHSEDRQICCDKAGLTSCSKLATMKQCCNDSTQWLYEDLQAIAFLDTFSDFGKPALTTIPQKAGVVERSGSAPGTVVNAASDPNQPLYLMHCSLIYYG